MLNYGSEKLSETRLRTPEAGGLVIAPNIEVAKHMANLLEIIEGEKPVLVHSNMSNSEDLIRYFRNSNKFNPAFDVTPARYITKLITENGLIEPKKSEIMKNLQK